MPGQRKDYQSDWSADSFLRWAISIGFLEYDRTTDECQLSEAGFKYASAPDGSAAEHEALESAFLSYPPVGRILLLLENGMPLTKFEIGSQLGFLGEAGFTSIPQHLFVNSLKDASTAKERKKILSDTEGTSDKYARTICAWLKQLGWVKQRPKEIMIINDYGCSAQSILQAYEITLKGRKTIKRIKGISKSSKIPRRVMWDMLATKAPDRDYLRNRRAYIIRFLHGKYRTVNEIIAHLHCKGLDETEATINDDIKNFINIGLIITKKQDRFIISDKITGLEIPNRSINTKKSNFSLIKDNLREKIKYINHKYLALLDLGLDSQSSREYEIMTADLFTSELNFKGSRLGNSRKPDVCVYYDQNGLIIDNKAYSNLYSLPISQADEMVRYIQENKERQFNMNPNEWWLIFDKEVKKFNFVFVSGGFTGSFRDRLQNISERTGVKGGAINSVNLLLLAEKVKSGILPHADLFTLFDSNDEILLQP